MELHAGEIRKVPFAVVGSGALAGEARAAQGLVVEIAIEAGGSLLDVEAALAVVTDQYKMLESAAVSLARFAPTPTSGDGILCSCRLAQSPTPQSNPLPPTRCQETSLAMYDGNALHTGGLAGEGHVLVAAEQRERFTFAARAPELRHAGDVVRIKTREGEDWQNRGRGNMGLGGEMDALMEIQGRLGLRSCGASA